jgi:hypothetical protein
MSDFKSILLGLKLKKAMLLSEIEYDDKKNDDQFLLLGKLEHEITITKKEILRATENIFG